MITINGHDITQYVNAALTFIIGIWFGHSLGMARAQRAVNGEKSN